MQPNIAFVTATQVKKLCNVSLFFKIKNAVAL